MASDTTQMGSYDVLGIPISATTLDTASRTIHGWAKDDLSRFVFIRDVHGVMQAQNDPELMRLHQDAAMVTPDGMPLVWLGQLAGAPVSRTCGPDLMEKVLGDSAQSGLTHFFYGGKPGVAEALKAAFLSRFPALRVVGADTPPFRPLTAAELNSVADEINGSGADVVWIGVSTPKQEFLMRDLAPLTSATFIGVGAAFDFHTNNVKRAPKWMQKTGLEWSWRLASEPRRLWRRYLIIAPLFVWSIFKASVRPKLQKS
ncbi:MAG: WecB/TagA/CpsF family glycosyltransferase [bacterium]|nr:WecB/TagA/CpsF family glycosyltransferase [bacterium]